jgi:hypothetical protein
MTGEKEAFVVSEVLLVMAVTILDCPEAMIVSPIANSVVNNVLLPVTVVPDELIVPVPETAVIARLPKSLAVPDILLIEFESRDIEFIFAPY